MAKVKTNELIGAQLDWLVAKCMGYVEQGVYGTPEFRDSGVYLRYCDAVLNSCYAPSTSWGKLARSSTGKLRKFSVMLAAHGVR